MGIPYLFYNLVRTNSHVLCKPSSPPERLFLDFNSIIHQCSASVVSSLTVSISKSVLQEKIFDRITRYVMDVIVPTAHPKQLLYIAIDGVAPLAKIQQQRKRRYMTAYRNELILQFKKNNNIPITDWDSNIITPGTDFMKDLDQYLHSFFENHKDHLDFEIIISGSNEPGEGEHKMIQYIKNNSREGLDMIYGLDADLIMLSLSCEATRSNIVLMRESEDQSFQYLDINRLREVISKDIPPLDYIALCFLLGNDFVPGLSFLKIKSGGIQTLMKCYKAVISSDTSLVYYDEKKEVYILNQSLLISLMEKLSTIEKEEMIKIHKEWCEVRQSFKNNKITKLDQYISTLESYPITTTKRNKLKIDLNPSNPKWQSIYYSVLFDTHDSAIIQSLTVSYIHGLNWIMNYYMNKIADNTWYYEYNYAPTATDLYMNLLTMPQEITKSQKDFKINEVIQLMLVIPPSSFNILPTNVQSLMKNAKLAYMFPYQFQINTYLKTFLWECSPVLPNIHVTKIIKCLAIN